MFVFPSQIVLKRCVCFIGVYEEKYEEGDCILKGLCDAWRKVKCCVVSYVVSFFNGITAFVS